MRKEEEREGKSKDVKRSDKGAMRGEEERMNGEECWIDGWSDEREGTERWLEG